MESRANITPIDKEISISPSAVFNCKINPEGKIDYANHQFCEVSGYEEYELIGEPMQIFRHPDMPEVFFEILNERLQKKEPMRLFAKFLAKDGRYFWLMIDFETKVDKEGNILAHYSSSKAAPLYAVHKIASLHDILAKIEEKTGNTEASRRYLIGFLEERNMNYNQFVEELSVSHPEYEKPFQASYTTQATTLNQGLGYNPSFDLAGDFTSPHKVKGQKKKKTLLKKLFGK